MTIGVDAPAMFPPRSSYRHGPPSLSRVRGRPKFPGVVPSCDRHSATMRPSDSPVPSAGAPVPLALGLPRCGSFFLIGRACVRERVGASEHW